MNGLMGIVLIKMNQDFVAQGNFQTECARNNMVTACVYNELGGYCIQEMMVPTISSLVEDPICTSEYSINFLF